MLHSIPTRFYTILLVIICKVHMLCSLFFTSVTIHYCSYVHMLYSLFFTSVTIHYCSYVHMLYSLFFTSVTIHYCSYVHLLQSLFFILLFIWFLVIIPDVHLLKPLFANVASHHQHKQSFYHLAQVQTSQ